MRSPLESASVKARQAARSGDWATVIHCARTVLDADPKSAEGYFLLGLADKAAGRVHSAADAFERALTLDEARSETAIELADVYLTLERHSAAAELLGRYRSRLGDNPLYLDRAGRTYVRLGTPATALPLHELANDLQPGIDRFQASLAAVAAQLGRRDTASELYEGLLERHPGHQLYHYELSLLGRAEDDSHVGQMLDVLESRTAPPSKNVYLYYALGKEYEDLERWNEAFEYYAKAGDAIAGVSQYDLQSDLATIERVGEVCTSAWIARDPPTLPPDVPDKTPIFVFGLPRTGTHLAEHIVSKHSLVDSAGASRFMETVLRRECGVARDASVTAQTISAAAGKDIGHLANAYLKAIQYRLGSAPLFIDIPCEHILYLGFLAKAFPTAPLIALDRNPMDACCSLYTQSFTRYSYSLETLGQYYIAYTRLLSHWRSVLPERLIEVRYETLLSDQDAETRRLLETLGLEFDPACAQRDEYDDDGAVGRWRHFEQQLDALRRQLEAGGIDSG